MTDASLAVPAPSPRRKSRAWGKLKRNRSAMVGGIFVSFFVVIAVLAPILPIADPTATDWGAIRLAPSAEHWLGTDEIGRDILSRMIWGARASLMAGVVSVLIALAVGVPLGVLAGYFGGWTDQIIVARHRCAAGDALPDPGHRAGRLSRSQPDQCDDRHRPVRRARLHPPDARAGLVRQDRGLCRGRACHRPWPTQDHVPLHPAERLSRRSWCRRR